MQRVGSVEMKTKGERKFTLKKRDNGYQGCLGESSRRRGKPVRGKGEEGQGLREFLVAGSSLLHHRVHSHEKGRQRIERR